MFHVFTCLILAAQLAGHGTQRVGSADVSIDVFVSVREGDAGPEYLIRIRNRTDRRLMLFNHCMVTVGGTEVVSATKPIPPEIPNFSLEEIAALTQSNEDVVTLRVELPSKVPLMRLPYSLGGKIEAISIAPQNVYYMPVVLPVPVDDTLSAKVTLIRNNRTIATKDFSIGTVARGGRLSR